MINPGCEYIPRFRALQDDCHDMVVSLLAGKSAEVEEERLIQEWLRNKLSMPSQASVEGALRGWEKRRNMAEGG